MDIDIPVTYLKTFVHRPLRPYGVAIDPLNNVYVAEAMGGKVDKFDQDGNFISSFGAGEGGLFKKRGRLSRPASITQDSNGFSYVADFKQNCVFKFDPQGHFIETFGSPGNGDGQFDHCVSLKMDRDYNLWVVDRDNHRLQKFDTAGRFLFKFGLFGRDKNGAGFFDRPSDVAFDQHGSIYVTDELNSRVQKFDSEGNFICLFGKTSKKEAELSNPRGIAIDSQGRVYVTDAYKDAVIVFDAYGRFLFPIVGPMITGGALYRPLGIAVNSNGLIYVADNQNNRIMVFKHENQPLSAADPE